MSIISHALVHTERPERYAKQLASHFSSKISTDWDGSHGFLEFVGAGADSEDPRKAFEGTARVLLEATPEGLLISIDAPENLRERFQGVIDRHLLRFGARENLEINWEDS